MSDPNSFAALAGQLFWFVAAVCALALVTGTGALAAEPPKADTAKSKPMNMDMPMAGGMKKEGMKKGDVKKAAEKKEREMREMIEKEEASARTMKK